MFVESQYRRARKNEHFCGRQSRPKASRVCSFRTHGRVRRVAPASDRCGCIARRLRTGVHGSVALPSPTGSQAQAQTEQAFASQNLRRTASRLTYTKLHSKIEKYYAPVP